ncbi:hypothetical protein [Burkholderia ubonensis]|nr:hypothetical protein [Burkholderia ubonensis]
MSTLAQILSRPLMKPAVNTKNTSVNSKKSRSLIRFTDIFPISVAMLESIPFRLDQRMKQIDEERDRNAPRNPQHRFPLLFCLRGKPAAPSTSPARTAAAALQAGRRPPHARRENGMRQCRNPRIKAVFNFLS